MATTDELVLEYSKLKAAADDIVLKRAAAAARLEDAEGAMAVSVAEVKALGFGTVAELQLAISETETALRVQLEAADEKLKEGGYA